ncbi:MAG TPA: addiction module protein [Thermoanaerobaculia bacterium]|nr:addiction module protein [Thermoanaerobaculia bacterium]
MAGMSRTKFDFSHLTADERVELAEELWDSLAEIQEALPLTGPHQEELDRRLADYQKDRDPGSPWAEVVDRIKESGA